MLFGARAMPRRALRSRISSAWPAATTRSSSISGSRNAISICGATTLRVRGPVRIWSARRARPRRGSFPVRAARARQPRRVHCADARAGDRFPWRFLVRRGPQQPRHPTSSRTRTKLPRRFSPSSTRSSRPAHAPSAPRGSPAGGVTGRVITRTRCGRSSRRLPRFRVPIIGRRSCIGRDGRTGRSGRESSRRHGSIWSFTTTEARTGRLAKKHVSRMADADPVADRAISASFRAQRRSPAPDRRSYPAPPRQRSL